VNVLGLQILLCVIIIVIIIILMMIKCVVMLCNNVAKEPDDNAKCDLLENGSNFDPVSFEPT
jgi:hypothetical protein